jgi:hypothetical protein
MPTKARKSRRPQQAAVLADRPPRLARLAPAPPPRLAVPAAPALDLEARLARAERYGHRISQLPVGAGRERAMPPAPASSTPAVAHRPSERSTRSATARTADEERANPRTPLLRPRRQQILIDESPEIGPEHHQAIATGTVSDAKTGLKVLSGLGNTASIASRAADYFDTSNTVPGLVPGLGIGAGTVSALGSTVDTALTLRQIATGTERTGDKAQLGLEAVSSAANATVSSASAAAKASTLLGSTATTAVSVASPAALVMGGADLIGGGVSAYRASGRQRQLEAIRRQRTATDYEKGVARFAAGSQRTKKRRGWGTMLKGALGIGGGLALLLGAGPVGWGLLAGGALLAGGMSLYKQYRKHREGKKILADPEYQRQLTAQGTVRIPTAEDLAKQKWTKRWNPLNSKSSRTHDLIRAQLAQNLESVVADPSGDDAQADNAVTNPLRAIVGILGLRNKGKKRAKAADIANALGG